MTVSATTAEPTSAPTPPGRLGTPIRAEQALPYLDALGTWLARRKEDLDTVDAAAMSSADQAAVTGDLVVSMALWKAVSDRFALLRATFDSGRVGPTEAERLSTLVWGRLDVAPDTAGRSGGFAITLPEACRLSDAMTASLRARLALDGGRAQAGARLAIVRASIERIRDQVALVPAGSGRDEARTALGRLDQRAADIESRVVRGADVGGLLGPIEVEVATMERDLIVASAARVAARKDREETLRRRDELAATAEAVASLEARCVATLTDPPTLAIPRVAALGDVPTEPALLEAYEARLDTVARAVDRARAAYAGALARREEAVGLAGALAAQLRATALTGAAATDLDTLGRLLDQATAAIPTDVARTTALAAAIQSYLSTATRKA